MLDIINVSLYRFSHFRYLNLHFMVAIIGWWRVFWYLETFLVIWAYHLYRFQNSNSVMAIELNIMMMMQRDASWCIYLCGSFVAPTSSLIIPTYVFISYFLKIQNVLINVIHTPCCERNVIRISYYSIKRKLKMFSVCVIGFVIDKALISSCK